jgi:hypothetical protein
MKVSPPQPRDQERDMKYRGRKLTRVLIAIACVALARWLFDVAGYWPHGYSLSLSQFVCFLFCFIGIERVVSAAVDLATTAFAPMATIQHRD